MGAAMRVRAVYTGTLRREDVVLVAHKRSTGRAFVHKSVHGMAGTHDSHRIKRGLHSMLDLDRRGGRIFQRDDSTLILADYSRFTSDQIECIQTVYPHLHASVVQSDASASGFLVVFQVGSPSYKRAVALLAVHVMVFAGGLCALWFSNSKEAHAV